jgi:hypothetical protein
MADTPRSVSTLQTLLADNTSGQISPQDLRDFLVSSLGIYGSLYVLDGATQQDNIGTSGSKLTAFTNEGNSHGTTPSHSNDQITIDIDGKYDVQFQCSFSCAQASSDIAFRLRKNGSELNYGATRSIGTIGDNGSCSFIASAIDLVATDVLTIYVESDTATDDITVIDAQFSVRMVG